jgi:RNA polymerase primary sigma factor
MGSTDRTRRRACLTREEERELAGVIRHGEAARLALVAGGHAPAEQRRLERRRAAGDDAKEQFVLANLGLVVTIARRRWRRGLELEDMIQEGYFGLRRAVERFDPAHGVRFSTYAAWAIREAIDQAPNGNVPVRLPADIVTLRTKVLHMHDRLVAEGHVPSAETIAYRLDLPVERVEHAMTWDRAARSLDEPMNDAGASLGELLPTDADQDPEQAALRSARALDLHRMLAQLNPRERSVLLLRYGFHGGEGRTLTEISRDSGVTKQRVRQIEEKALRKLRSSSLAAALAG